MSNKVEDFPSLNPNIKQMPKKQQGPTYAQLANDWKTHDEYVKGMSVEEQSQPKFNRKQEEAKPIPVFEKCDRFEDEQIVEQSEEDGWIKVERVKKQKRELTLIEKYGDPDDPEEEETVCGGEEKPSHQTCWEDKR
jgi:hypothetical protein